MSESPSFPNVVPERIDPERLSRVLQESGWRVAGRRSGVYIRLSPPAEESYSVVVPLDRKAPEYSSVMRSALIDISRLATRDLWGSDVAARLVVDPADSFRFRAETAAPAGLIAWTHGEQLIQSSRRILSAGAKTYIDHLKYYGNRFGQFANRYLDSVLMGQTAPGSYVVTAYTPASGFIPVSGTTHETPALLDSLRSQTDMASTRGIGLSVITAAEATREAIEHYRSRASLAAFDELVERGVSYEMTVALSALVEGSDGADVTVEWDPVLEPPAVAHTTHVELRPSDLEVLSRASHHLAENITDADEITVMGRVHLLTQRESGGPGVIGIENLSSKKPKKLRVHLNDEQYHRALRAHDEDRAVVVEGHLEREGNINWLYDGSLVGVLAHVEQIKEELKSQPFDQIPGQDELNISNPEPEPAPPIHPEANPR
jgi:hypothetical protein